MHTKGNYPVGERMVMVERWGDSRSSIFKKANWDSGQSTAWLMVGDSASPVMLNPTVKVVLEFSSTDS